MFQRRYEEGYDLFVFADYVSWLELHHPEVLPSHHYSLIPALHSDDGDSPASISPLNDNPDSNDPTSTGFCFADAFSSVVPETPVNVASGD